MTETSFASLSPTLLARKGGAKPAMRPQNTAGPVDGAQAAASLEDLGWNDMGEESAEKVVRLKPEADVPADATSPVRDTIERIATKLEAPATRAPANAEPEAKAGSSTQTKPKPASGKRAAFTLRLDQDRHLKLRLACTVTSKSAQALVTDALDAFLSEMPGIENLAAQVARD